MPPPDGDLLGNFAEGDPRYGELKESRTGDLSPLDASTGARVRAQDGVVPPNLGTSLEPWNLLYANGIVVDGAQISVRDLANFTPITLTRAASAPLTGQSNQTYRWPFAELTRAIVYVVGPQGGGGGGDGGFYCRPGLDTPVSFGGLADNDRPPTMTNGWWPGLGANLVPRLSSIPRNVYGNGVFITTDAAVAQLGLRAGVNGTALVSSIVLEGLTTGDSFGLSFGKGGAGGVAGTGAGFPSTKTFAVSGPHSTEYYYDPGLGWTAGGNPSSAIGTTHFSRDGRVVRVGETTDADYDSLELPENLSLASLSFPGGTSKSFAATSDVASGAFPTNFYLTSGITGHGGDAGLPAQGDSGTPVRAGDGTAGTAGHDGFILIFPQL